MTTVDEGLAPSSDSFWEIDSYKTTVKRTEDGLHMCGELMKLIAERSEIEMKYSTKLKTWCKKWNDIIDKGTEYETNKAVLLGSLKEADAMGDVHNSIKDRLMEVHADLRKWKNDNFKKQMVTGCKEAKQFEEDFKKAQKPWAKKFAKVQKNKKDYYNACKQEKTTSQQAISQSGTTTEDQVKKWQEKVTKYENDVIQTKEKYEEALKDLNVFRPVYIGDMTEVFERSQKFEEKRLGYFKDILIGIHDCLDLTKINRISEIYKQFRQTIELSDAAKDLTWWSLNRGVDMPMNWPEFEEFSLEQSAMTRKDKNRASILISNHSDTNRPSKSSSHSLAGKDSVQESKGLAAERAVVPQTIVSQTNVVQTNVVQTNVAQTNVVQRQESYDPDLNPFEDDPDSHAGRGGKAVGGGEKKVEAPSGGASKANQSNGKVMPSIAEDPQISNPFDDDDDEEEEDLSNRPGVPVQALFDYDGQEEDELSFKSGDKFEQLKDRDDQGWCTGRRNGRTGLYPDNYVRVIQP